jgi:hypothetical protein
VPEAVSSTPSVPDADEVDAVSARRRRRQTVSAGGAATRPPMTATIKIPVVWIVIGAIVRVGRGSLYALGSSPRTSAD